MVKKMSKSDDSDFSRINLVDDKDTISNKIKKAKTDSDSIMGLEALDNLMESLIKILFYRDLRQLTY